MSGVHQNGLIIPPHLKRTLSVGYVSGQMVHEAFMVCMIGLFGFDAGQRRCITSMCRGKGLYVPGNRNEAVRAFLTSTTEYLIFIDTDIIFEAQQVYELLDAADPVERPIVSGLYFTYLDEHIYPVWHETYEDGDLGTVRKVAPGLQELTGTGMGFCVIHRKVFEAMAAAHPNYPWQWFDHDAFTRPDGTTMMMGEDITFCMRAAKAGFKTWGHGGVCVEHEKSQRVTLKTFQDAIGAPGGLTSLTGAR